ncbi:restriction endonuclease subunit S [Bacillus cereus]|uniref:Restriction endonuclease subunit S n=1 Tax=Bacillus cereus TaxID=1396 RepID=A0A2C0EV90_BACCE|nr:restriction endonuclease subunit S [Bacillus cereus]PFA10285.1 restriction endonuclease subunit S [Bacillus cereus]PGQ10529.1 restriction endonuclease subunit S [Bacillus cereus]
MSIVRLGEVCDFQGGSQPPKSEHIYEKKEGYVRFVQIRDFESDNYKTYVPISKRNKLCEREDILIARYGASVGKILNGLEGAYNVALIKTIPDTKRLNKRYLYYYLNTKTIQTFIQVRAKRSAQEGIDPKELKKQFIYLPSLEEQKKIVTVLDKAQALIEKKKEVIVKLDELVQSVFLSMFGDPIKNEKGWEQTSLSNIGEITGGLQVTPKRSIHPIEVPYLRVANVFRDFLNLSEIKFIKVTQKEFERTKLATGDILIVEGHGNQNEIGRSAVWDGSIQMCVHQNHLIKFRANKKLVNSVFVSAVLNSSSGRRQLLRYSNTTSGLNTISTSTVKKVVVYLPPLELQNEFEFIIAKVKAEKKQMEQSLSRMGNNFQSILQRAFIGELLINK